MDFSQRWAKKVQKSTFFGVKKAQFLAVFGKVKNLNKCNHFSGQFFLANFFSNNDYIFYFYFRLIHASSDWTDWLKNEYQEDTAGFIKGQ